MRSQLFWIPGEERKFKRCRSVAFIPACKREREVAASHAVAGAGVSATGVEVDSITGVTVGEAVGVSRFVAAGEGEESPGTDSIVPAGDGSGTDVDPVAGFAMEVGDGSGAAVVIDSPVVVRDPIGLTVDVREMDANVVGIVVEFTPGVAEELEEPDFVGGSTVEAGGKASGVVLLRNRRKRINRMIATINLKRS